MTWFDHLKTLVEARGSTTSVEGLRLVVPPASDAGFEVWAFEEGGTYTVGFDAWHETFASEGPATELFLAGLSGECRLAVLKRGRAESSWTMERLRDGAWIPVSKTGLFFFPFWRRPVVQYRRNAPDAA